MTGIIEQSFSLNLRIMRVLRLYPSENHSYFYKVQAYILYFTLMIPVSSLGILYLVLSEDINISEEGENAMLLIQTLSFSAKILPFIRNAPKIKKCINYFEDCRFATQQEEHHKIIANCIRICRRNSTVYITGITWGVINLDTKPLLLHGYRLPIMVWLGPLKPAMGSKSYYILYLYLAMAVAFACFSGTLIDPLIGGLACHAATQVRILKENLTQLSGHPFETIYGKIKHCVDHHNAVLSFVKEYEECFSLVVFCQFLASSMAICLCCFQLSVMASFNFGALVVVTFISLLLVEIYFYCYYGTLLFEESNSLANAIYMSDWYQFDVKSKKALITMMERAKRPMMVTAAKILDMSLQTFTLVIRRSFSLLAVLRSYQ